MKIKLYIQPVITQALGPYKRYALWVQGCNRHCKGCVAPDSWDIDGGAEYSVEEITAKIVNATDIEGITISGGEPFFQQKALCDLIYKIREHKDIGVIIYTGFGYEEILDSELASLADIIIDGEYIDNLNDGLSLRGSSNQNVICLTNRYESLIKDYYGVPGRKIELHLNGNKSFVVGIPSKNMKL